MVKGYLIKSEFTLYFDFEAQSWEVLCTISLAKFSAQSIHVEIRVSMQSMASHASELHYQSEGFLNSKKNRS